MANKQNLKTPSTSEARERGKKGGKASAKARKEKKILRELLEDALLTNTKTGNRYIDITNALIQEAEKGNVKAYETIRDTLGQKPKENVKIGVSYEDYIKKVEDEEEY